ncbi:MAG: hypothetical protein IJ583_07235 [Firmicutes bacterium]|nr:hypothetical protein [Bacillota bacterium]
MIKTLKVLIFFIFALCMNIQGIASDDIGIIINGKQMYSDVPPQIIDGRTMVPMRAVFEALDANIYWDNATRTVTADKNGNTIKMTIGENEFYKNNDPLSLDVPAQIIDGRTLVPVRAVSESLDCKVSWNNDTRTVIIEYGEQQTHEYHFRNEKYLNEHFQKHGSEFDYSSAAEYEAAAGRVINDSRALHKVEKEDGDDVYYIKETNEFVVLSVDGYIRTYFKPSGGIKYFEKQ